MGEQLGIDRLDPGAGRLDLGARIAPAGRVERRFFRVRDLGFHDLDVVGQPLGVLAQPFGNGGQHGVIGARLGVADQPGHPIVEHARDIAGFIGRGPVATIPEIGKQRIGAVGLALGVSVGLGLIGLAVRFQGGAVELLALGDKLFIVRVGGERRRDRG